MNDKKRAEIKTDILKLIDKIKNSDFLIIVEGKKDKNALSALGLKNIFILKKGSLAEAIEKIIKMDKECVILTDFDDEGKKLYRILKRELVENGIKIDDKLRALLIKENLSHIEGLFSFLQ